MNQKNLQNKHIKIEKLQINQPSLRPRIRSVFQEVTNMEFSFIQKVESKEETKKPLISKRRNALIPVPKDLKPIQIDYLPILTTPPVGNSVIQTSTVIVFQSKYQKEIQEFERQIEINSKTQIFNINQHDFTEIELQQAMDWMIYQMQKFTKVTCESIFTAIELVYAYLVNTYHKEFQDLELITGCCIFLASKLIDLCPIYYEDLIVQVLECKFDSNQIIQQEKDICQTLNFNLLVYTPIQIVYRILQDLRDTIILYYEKGQIDILTKLIINNLLLIELGYQFRDISIIYKVISTILVTLIENKIDKRVVNY